MSYRRNEIYIDNELQFYAKLRRRQVCGDKAKVDSISEDEIICADLRNLWTTENPSWVLAWDKRETLRQAYKKQLDTLENEVLA